MLLVPRPFHNLRKAMKLEIIQKISVILDIKNDNKKDNGNNCKILTNRIFHLLYGNFMLQIIITANLLSYFKSMNDQDFI